MAYIGNAPPSFFTAVATDVFSANGTATTFTLSKSITSTTDIQVVIDNIQQNPFSGSYSVSGSTLTLSTAPSSGSNNIVVSYRQATIGSTIASANSVSSGSLQPDLSLSGNVNFSSTGARITGDFTNATQANRVAFQTSTTNGASALTVIPNGTGTQTSINLFDNSDPTNAGTLNFVSNPTEKSVRSTITGTGTYLPMTFYTGGSEAMRIDTSRNVGIGTSSTLGNSLLNVLTGITARTAAASGVTPYFQSYNGNASTDLKTWRFGTVTAGDLVFETVNDAYSSATERMRIDSSSNLKFNSGYGSVATAYGCRAWVNFNGTSTVAIRASGNVSSITDNGVGDYTVNFTNAMPDGNYAYHIGSKQDQAGVGDAAFPTNGTPTGVTDGAAGMTTTRIRLRFVNLDGTASLRDQEVVCVSIFR